MNQPKPNRYELPFSNMIGAMLILLLCVLGYVGFRGLVRENQPVPTSTVDYQPWLKSGRGEERLQVVAPPTDQGWRATSARYSAGSDPHWHLGGLTSDGKFIGVEESLQSVEDQVQTYVDADAKAGPEVTLSGISWQSWSDGGGDYALTRTLKAPSGDVPETLLVVGSAPADEIQEFAAGLTER